MNQEKTLLPFHGSYFETKVTLRIDSYVQGHGLYIGLDEEGGYPLTDLTVNLPGSRLKQGQAYINPDERRFSLLHRTEPLGNRSATARIFWVLQLQGS